MALGNRRHKIQRPFFATWSLYTPHLFSHPPLHLFPRLCKYLEFHDGATMFHFTLISQMLFPGIPFRLDPSHPETIHRANPCPPQK